MLLSMTGQGHATGQLGDTTIEVDVRSVNNRFLKVTSRIGDRLQNFESQIEPIVRELVRRGTVQVTIFLTGKPRTDDYRFNEIAVEAYARQAIAIAERLNLSSSVQIGQLLQLPGVVNDCKQDTDDSELQLVVKDVLRKSLLMMNQMREQEGQSMGNELAKSLEELKARASVVAQRSPMVVEDYQNRLHAKIEKALESFNTALAPIDIFKEVQIFTDRCDVREELVRLESHFKLFNQACQDKVSQGRKLDFLVQELNREINTIGSKANDATITEQVVNMKTTLEQVRELIQNIE